MSGGVGVGAWVRASARERKPSSGFVLDAADLGRGGVEGRLWTACPDS